MNSNQPSCDDCHLFFETNAQLDAHIGEAHILLSNRENEKLPKVTLYPCACCDFHATSQEVLNDHKASSHRNIKSNGHKYIS